MLKLRIKRIKAFADWLRAYKVVLDGEVVGQVRNGQQVEFDVAPGRHEVRLKIDWTGSNTVTFDAAQDPLDFECGSRFRGKDIFIRGPAHVLAPAGDYLWLRRREGKEDRPS